MRTPSIREKRENPRSTETRNKPALREHRTQKLRRAANGKLTSVWRGCAGVSTGRAFGQSFGLASRRRLCDAPASLTPAPVGRAAKRWSACAGRSLPPLCEIDARRIVLLKPSSLGDVVHSLPVLTALRRRFPLSHIRWVVNQSYAELLHGHPDLDEVLTIDRDSSRGGLSRRARVPLPH